MIHPHVQLCMPNGPMGAIIKPMEWRKHNSSKLDLFARDWLAFIKPLKLRRRVLMSYRQMRVEQYKNDVRGWWFSLSAYEQGKLFSIRKDTGQKVISHFNGAKYQRGSVGMMMGAGMQVSSGNVLSLDATDNSAFNIDVSPPGALDAGFGVIRDGTIDRTNSGGTSQINSATDWITPRTSTVGDGWEVKWNVIINGPQINDENFTEDTWTTINLTGLGLYVGQLESGPSSGSTFEFDIGEDGTSTSDVNQDYIVEAGDLI